MDPANMLHAAVLFLPQLKDVTEQIGQLTEAITAASAAVGEFSARWCLDT